MNKNKINSRSHSHLFTGASTAIMATAMMSVPANAQSIVTAPTFNSVLEAHTTMGNTTPQVNSGAIDANNTSFDGSITNNGVSNGVFENNNNAATATAIANRNGVAASLETIGSSTLPDDGIALSGVSVNSGAVTASATDANIGINATDFATGSVDVVGNTASSSATINEGSATYALAITGSEPVGYGNLATDNAAVTTDLSGSADNVAALDGTLLVSSVQIATAADSSGAVTSSSDTFLNIATTADATVNGTATLDSNTASSSFTANTRSASIGLAADDSNTSVTAAMSNAQLFDANVSGDAAALTSGTTISATIARDGTAPTQTTSFDDSSLSVSTNVVSAAAQGNIASTNITLADGLAYNTAAGNTASASIDDTAADDGDKLADISAIGGLIGVNTQVVQDGVLEAEVTSTSIAATVQSLDGSNVDVSGNRTLATATGNDVTAQIASGASSATFDASAVLASRQQLDDAGVTANASSSSVSVTVGDANASSEFVDSSVTLGGNIQAASATGSRARQSIDLEATALNANDAGSATLSIDQTPAAGDEAVSAAGAVVIASAMINQGSAVSATNTGAVIEFDAADTATNTTTAIAGNAQQAFAVGSDAGNSLSLTGTDVGSGAGIANLQTNDATSSVTAAQTGTIDATFAGSLVASSAEITGNNQSAIARGTVSSNNLSVDAQTVALGAGGTATTSTPNSLNADATAAFGVVNVQQVLAGVTASIEPTGTNAYRMQVNGGVTDASAIVNNNTMMAQAQGAVTANSISLDVGTLTSTDSSGDAVIANLQNVSGANILATANGDADSVIETQIGGAALRSSIETSGNRVTASAEAARASNVLTVTGTSLSGSGLNAVSNGDPDNDINSVTAQFGVANTQVAGTGNVTSSLRETAAGGFASSSAVVTDLDGAVTTTSVASNGNLLQALSSSNRATNAVSLEGASLSQVTAGLSNVQASSQDVSALIGFEGTDATAGTSALTVTNSGTGTFSSGYSISAGGLVTNTSGAAVSFTLSSPLTAAEAAFLTARGFTGATTGGSTISIPNAGSADFSAFTNYVANTSGSTVVTFTGFTIPGTAGTPATYNSGGVFIDAEGAITSSTIAVEGNAVQGSSIGNSAANSVTIAANSADGVAAIGTGEVVIGANPEATADADTTLASTQTLEAGSSSLTEVYTTFGIDAALGTAITDSSLSVADNSVYGEAIGNTVSNTLRVAGNDLAGTATSGVLSNSQDATSADIAATTDMDVASNVVSAGSTIALDRNVNNALGLVNNATNTLVASSTNSTSTAQANATSDTATSQNAIADGSFALVSGQRATGTLNTSATTSVFNVGLVDAATDGISNGTVSMSDNVTRAESTANRAANTMSVGAEASLGSTASLLNQQMSSTTTVANATSNIRMGVNGTSPLESLDTSSASIEGNSTLALARGNSASNTLNYSAGATYTAATGSATLSGTTTSAQANAALLNDQMNSGSVTANATGTTSIVLNATSGGTAAGVLNSAVNNNNNNVTAFAVGNTVTNTIMVGAQTAGMPNVALGNQQRNTGAVTANATSVTYTIGSNGTVLGSTMQNSGNAASATAIGNSSVSVVGGN